MHKQVAQDVLLCLDREALIVGVGIVDQLRVEVRPDAPSYFTSELENAETVFWVTGLRILQLMDEVGTFFRNDTLKLRHTTFDSHVP